MLASAAEDEAVWVLEGYVVVRPTWLLNNSTCRTSEKEPHVFDIHPPPFHTYLKPLSIGGGH